MFPDSTVDSNSNYVERPPATANVLLTCTWTQFLPLPWRRGIRLRMVIVLVLSPSVLWYPASVSLMLILSLVGLVVSGEVVDAPSCNSITPRSSAPYMHIHSVTLLMTWFTVSGFTIVQIEMLQGAGDCNIIHDSSSYCAETKILHKNNFTRIQYKICG